MDIIRVAPDRWSFIEASTGKRFVPFGANFVFDFPREEDGEMMRSLALMTEDVWRPKELKKAFEKARELHMNVMKVFLPLPQVLPDPQVNEYPAIRPMTPSLFERLDYLFDVAEQTEVYVSLSLAEWGVHSLKWFHDGGAFFGAREPGQPDSYRILANFWEAIAGHCREKAALFSYNLAVEFYLPSDNWGGVKGPGNGSVLFEDRYGAPAFHEWLGTRYADTGEMNAKYGTGYASFSDVPMPDELSWNPYLEKYNVPRQFLIDYNDFRECVNYFFFKNQCDAIRRADDQHMITAGLHPDQIGMAPKGGGWKIGGINNREYDIFDYVTIHLYTNLAYLIERPLLPSTFAEIVAPFQTSKEEIARRRRECLLYCRFIAGGRPIIVEEFGHASFDMEESYAETYKLLEELLGHVSGFMLWEYGHSYQELKNSSGPIDERLEICEWGKRWKTLNEPGGIIHDFPVQRLPARTVIRLDREEACAPVEKTAGEMIMKNWDAYRHPVDFELEENPTLASMKASGRCSIWNNQEK